MTDLLRDLQVVVAGSSRELRVASSWFVELGAHVLVRAGDGLELADRLWLGEPDVTPDEAHADLLIVEYGADETGLSAPVTVRYSGSSGAAPEPNVRLDSRGLAGAGGVAVAVGDPHRPPLPVPDGCLEHMIGSHLVAAGVAALLDGTAEVEVAGVDVVAWSVATNVNLYVPYGGEWRRAGRRANGSGGGYPYSVFDVGDGQYALIGRTSKDWEGFLDALGRPEWAQDPRYRDRVAMRDYPEEVDALLAPWLKGITRDELTACAAKHGFPGGPVLQPDEVIAMPALEGHWREVAVDGRAVRLPTDPFDLVQTPGDRAAPPLQNTLVLDLSWVWSGPAVGVALADLGATVIKVESATRPDNSRLRGKPIKLTVPAEAPLEELSPYFHAVNRGKRSVSLNLSTLEGRDVLARLAQKADVIIENLSPGVMERFGIAAHQVREDNPDCVYMSMRGYPSHPSTAGLRAYAPILSGGAGIEALVAYPDEDPIGMMTYGFSDANAASQGLMLVLAGLHARKTKQVGASITLSQLQAAVVANGLNLVRAQIGDVCPGLPFAEGEPVVDAADLAAGPWTSPDLFASVASRWLGPLPVSCLPWRREGKFPAPASAGPVLGQDTEHELSARLGMTSEEIDRLRGIGALT